MRPTPRQTLPSAIDWSALFEGDILHLADRYPQIIYNIGLETWALENPKQEMPERSDDEIAGLREGRYPEWWPSSFPRLQVRIKVTHNGINHVFGPTFFEARRAAAGWDAFQNIAKLLMSTAPNPFAGPLQIEILLPNGSPRGGYNGTVRIGTGSSLSGGMNGDDEDAWMPNEFKYLRAENRRHSEVQMRMFEASASVISASASAISATKGTKDEEEGGDWKTVIAEIAANVLGHFAGKSAEEDTKKDSKVNPPQIPARAQPLQIGDGNYPTEIDPAGPPAEQDGWGQDDDVNLDQAPEPDDQQVEQEVENDEEPVDENPLDGMSADELGAHLEAWIAKNKDKKGDIKKMGLKLAKHVL